jgi:hypothetical protein
MPSATPSSEKSSKVPNLKPDSVFCLMPKCKPGGSAGPRGVLWNVTSRLAEALGWIELQCDKCHQKWGVRTQPYEQS